MQSGVYLSGPPLPPGGEGALWGGCGFDVVVVVFGVVVVVLMWLLWFLVWLLWFWCGCCGFDVRVTGMKLREVQS